MSLKGDLNTRQEIQQAYEDSKYLSGIFSSIFFFLGLLHFKLKSKTKDSYI